MGLVDYELFCPPFALDFRNMPSAQAKAYFQWFCENIELRMQALRHVLDVNGGLSIPLDNTSSSLEPLGLWFQQNVDVRVMTKEEIEEYHKSMPDWLQGFLLHEVLNTETISLCIDFGMYLGETMRRYHPIVQWDYVKRPKTSVDIHQPVLIGFAHKIVMNPVALMRVFADKCRTVPFGNKLKPGEGGQEMLRMFDVWSKSVTGIP